MSEFGDEVRRLMAEQGLSARELARRSHWDASHLSKVLNGRKPVTRGLAAAVGDVLGAREALISLAPQAPAPSRRQREQPPGWVDGADDEIVALEFGRHAEASDVGAGTLERLELAVDDMAVAYPGIRPVDLLKRVRVYLGYTGRLLGARSTLAQHRRLLVTGGWMSLLGATCMIDLHRDQAAAAHLRTAAQLARETGHTEIAAWCLETRAWQLLTAGDYQAAVKLARAAQRAAPRGGSAYIQATAQEGRAWARLGATAETYDALSRVETLVSPLPMPERPEHHYRYDPAKSQAYVATTLSWLGDPAAEGYARQVLARLESSDDGPPRPRRAASTRLDLSLALLTSGRDDEAAGTAMDAITSGRLVPSNYWRAREVIGVVADHGLPEARELGEAYREACDADDPPALT